MSMNSFEVVRVFKFGYKLEVISGGSSWRGAYQLTELSQRCTV